MPILTIRSSETNETKIVAFRVGDEPEVDCSPPLAPGEERTLVRPMSKDLEVVARLEDGTEVPRRAALPAGGNVFLFTD